MDGWTIADQPAGHTNMTDYIHPFGTPTDQKGEGEGRKMGKGGGEEADEEEEEGAKEAVTRPQFEQFVRTDSFMTQTALHATTNKGAYLLCEQCH